MAKNKLSDLNNHLFAQIERLNDESITDEKAMFECEKAKALAQLASQILKTSQITLQAMKLVSDGNLTMNELPENIGLNQKG